MIKLIQEKILFIYRTTVRNQGKNNDVDDRGDPGDVTEGNDHGYRPYKVVHLLFMISSYFRQYIFIYNSLL